MRINVFIICLVCFLVPFMGSAITLALPRIGTHFSMNAVTLSLMATVYLVSTAMFQIPFSKLADIYGRKKWYCIGLLIFAVSTIACGFAPSTPVLLLLRFIEGVGSSVIFGTGMAILVSIYPPEKRGYILGINTAVVYAALAAGPLIGGLMTDHWGWQSLFIITGALCVIVFVVTLFSLDKRLDFSLKANMNLVDKHHKDEVQSLKSAQKQPDWAGPCAITFCNRFKWRICHLKSAQKQPDWAGPCAITFCNRFKWKIYHLKSAQKVPTHAGKPRLFDGVGSCIFALAILAIVYGFTKLQEVSGVVSLITGIVLSFLFVLYESRIENPVLNIKLLTRKRVLAMSTLAALINYASTAGLSFMLSLYLQYIRGFKAKEAGLIIISQAVIQSIVALISGRLSDKINPAKLATTGMSIIVVGIAGLVFVDNDTSVGYIVALLLLLGIGYGLFSSPNTNVIMGSVAPKYYGQASAITGTARLIGQAFSLGIAGMIISLYLGEHKITPEVFPQFLLSIKTTFIVFLVLCVLGVWASTGRLEKQTK